MNDVDSALTGTRAAVNGLLTAADKCGAAWTVPRAPGKWSPSQVVEHVALVLEESANAISGTPTKLPKFPFFVRPLAKIFLFNRVVRSGTFPKTRTGKTFDPVTGSPNPDSARQRLEAAFARFDRACREAAVRGERVDVGMFGSVAIADYARFQESHTRHHRKQLPRTD